MLITDRTDSGAVLAHDIQKELLVRGDLDKYASCKCGFTVHTTQFTQRRPGLLETNIMVKLRAMYSPFM